MKSYKILECENIEIISNELYNFLKDREHLQRKDLQFWNFLSKKDLFELLQRSTYTMSWFNSLKLKVREGSFTIWNEKIQTHPHVDIPPVVAKINVPVLNTKDTYNIWFNNNGDEIDSVECIHPIVLRSDILHTVKLGPRAKLPRIQMSFCFYEEPIQYLK